MKLSIKTNIEVDGDEQTVTVVAEYAAGLVERIYDGEAVAVTIISVLDDDGVEHEPTKAEMERIQEEVINEILELQDDGAE